MTFNRGEDSRNRNPYQMTEEQRKEWCQRAGIPFKEWESFASFWGYFKQEFNPWEELDENTLNVLLDNPGADVRGASIKNRSSLPDLPGLYFVCQAHPFPRLSIQEVVASPSAYVRHTQQWEQSCKPLDKVIYIGVSLHSILERWKNHDKRKEIEKYTEFCRQPAWIYTYTIYDYLLTRVDLQSAEDLITIFSSAGDSVSSQQSSQRALEVIENSSIFDDFLIDMPSAKRILQAMEISAIKRFKPPLNKLGLSKKEAG